MIGRRLGRRPPEPRRLAAIPHLHAYAARDLPTPPEVIDWTREIAPGSWGMCLNDEIGDCTIAAVAHALALWESYCPPLSFMTDTEVVQVYEAVAGYRPSRDGTITTNATDQGASCLDVLHHWMLHGVPLAGDSDRLQGFCQITPSHHLHVRQGLWLFGCLYAGVNLTQAQQNQEVWDVGGDETPWGGHCILIAGADDDGLTCITWGQTQRMTWAFWDAAVEEVYPLFSWRWVNFDGTPVSPADFRFDELANDLNILAQTG